MADISISKNNCHVESPTLGFEPASAGVQTSMYEQSIHSTITALATLGKIFVMSKPWTIWQQRSKNTWWNFMNHFFEILQNHEKWHAIVSLPKPWTIVWRFSWFWRISKYDGNHDETTYYSSGLLNFRWLMGHSAKIAKVHGPQAQIMLVRYWIFSQWVSNTLWVVEKWRKHAYASIVIMTD